MSDNHQKAKDDGIRQSLLRAGIGEHYHRRSLAELGASGERMSAWVQSESREFVRSGGCIHVHGRGVRGLDGTLLLAKGLHLTGTGCLVVPMVRLLIVLERNNAEALESMGDAPLLVVTRFYNPAEKTDVPLTPWQRSLVESYLSERLQCGMPVALHATQNLTPQVPLWWRPDFLEEFGRKLMTFEVQS